MTILGPQEKIETLTREEIVDYVRTHYYGSRMVIAACGPVEHEQIVALAEKSFSKVPSGPASGKQVVKTSPRVVGSDMRYREDSLDYLTVAYAFPVAGWNDPDNTVLTVIEFLLGSYVKGGTMHSSSKMIQSIIDDDLAVKVDPFTTLYSDTGLFGLRMVCEPIGPQDLMHVVTSTMTDLCYNLDDAKLREAKLHAKSAVLAALDTSTNNCENLGRQMLWHGRRIHPLEQLQRIDAVDAAAVKACANRYFFDTDPLLASIGNSHELPDYNWLRRRTYFLKY